MEITHKPRVLVTGVTGYVGSWTCLKLLQSGEYRVRGSVRDPTDSDKIEILKDAFGDLFNELEVVKMELMHQTSIRLAVQG